MINVTRYGYVFRGCLFNFDYTFKKGNSYLIVVEAIENRKVPTIMIKNLTTKEKRVIEVQIDAI